MSDRRLAPAGDLLVAVLEGIERLEAKVGDGPGRGCAGACGGQGGPLTVPANWLDGVPDGVAADLGWFTGHRAQVRRQGPALHLLLFWPNGSFALRELVAGPYA